ncbi:MAG: hypothetical protein PUE33_00620 [bacterium]|nr:hypothetical protein [Mycoplasmatota bacterium]MDD6756553.1 hypothetical protein [bacterium]MDY2908192.1 hypothetical protein [Candidatus Faecimonas sp.]
MSKKLSKKQRYIIVGVTAAWGLIFIGSGISMSFMNTPITKTTKELKITQKRVANMKSNEILLKPMEQEINQPISMNVKDYLENANDIDNKIINELQLDTSMVNVNQAGDYTYTITYKKKTFNGTFTIKEKPLPDMVLTLKTLNLEVGSALSTDIQNYITETLTDEVKQNIKLDLTNVNTAQAGNYQYTVTYNGRLYTGTITIYEPNKTENPTKKPDDTTSTDNTETETNDSDK